MALEGGGEQTAQQRGRMKDRGQKWRKRGDALFVQKDAYNSLFQAEAEIFYPERADFFGDRAEGDERYDGIFTSVPQRLRRDMANNLGAMLRPRGKEWFKCVARPEQLNEEKANARWLEKATRTQRNVVYSPPANFTRAMSESDNDYVCFGNAIVRHTYNQFKDGLLFSCAHLKDCAWAENHENQVDELHERMSMTLKQAVGLFGKENLPKEWRENCEDHPERKVKVQRCVAPIDEYDYEKGEKPRRNARFLSIYMACEVDEKEAGLGEGYFNWFPYLVRRWMTVSGEPYGRSPCAGVALADARTLNVAQQALLKSVEWAVDPPKTAAHDAIVGEINLRAGAITYYDPEALGQSPNRKAIENLESGDPRFGVELTAMLQAEMGRIFFQNLLKLPDKEMTAYEAGKWIEEYVRNAAPVFEPMEAENASLMDAVFERIMDAGGFMPIGEIPEALQGAEVSFEFETPLSQAYKDIKGQQASQLVTDMAVQAELSPDSLDNIDFDAVTRDRMGNLPTDWVRSPEMVKSMRDSRAESQAEEQQKQEQAVAADMLLKAKPENVNKLQNAMENA